MPMITGKTLNSNLKLNRKLLKRSPRHVHGASLGNIPRSNVKHMVKESGKRRVAIGAAAQATRRKPVPTHLKLKNLNKIF